VRARVTSQQRTVKGRYLPMAELGEQSPMHVFKIWGGWFPVWGVGNCRIIGYFYVCVAPNSILAGLYHRRHCTHKAGLA